jgi:hypothetical protein
VRHALGDRDLDVAEVAHAVPELGEGIAQAREAQGGGAHVDAAAPGPQVHGHAEQVDVAHGYAFLGRYQLRPSRSSSSAASTGPIDPAA